MLLFIDACKEHTGNLGNSYLHNSFYTTRSNNKLSLDYELVFP